MDRTALRSLIDASNAAESAVETLKGFGEARQSAEKESVEEIDRMAVEHAAQDLLNPFRRDERFGPIETGEDFVAREITLDGQSFTVSYHHSIDDEIGPHQGELSLRHYPAGPVGGLVDPDLAVIYVHGGGDMTATAEAIETFAAFYKATQMIRG